MPTYFPISNTVPQYVTPTGAPYSGAVLKAYEDNTTTPIQMATDYTGATLVNTITLNAQGFPAVSGSVVVPHIAENYKLALYPDAASATANTGAVWIVDDFQISSTASFGSLTDVASASTISLNSTATNYFNITGTATINEITLAEGVEVTVKFAGALTLTNGAFLVLKGGANILTGAGDIAVFRAEAGGVVRMLDYVDISESAIYVPPTPTGAVLISSQTVSAPVSSVEFINGTGGVVINSTYKDYEVRFNGVAGTVDANLLLELRRASDSAWSGSNHAAVRCNGTPTVSGTALNGIFTAAVGGSASVGGIVSLPALANRSSHKNGVTIASGSAVTIGYVVQSTGSLWDGTSIVVGDGVRFRMNTGNINSGIFNVYGYN